MSQDAGAGPSHRGGSIADSGDARDIDWLDQRYLSMQDDVVSALGRGDRDAAVGVLEESGELSVTDVDGWVWRIAQPAKTLDNQQPDFRFMHRYTKQGPVEARLFTSRNRFFDVPSLSRSYATQIGGRGWLPWVVKHSEPISYVAAAAVGVGLWALLADVVSSLPGVVIVAGVALLAAVLWLAALRLSPVPFREARRLSAIVGAVAIGVTGAVPWIATVEASISDEARTAVTAAVTTVAAVILFNLSRRVFPYFVAIIACMSAFGTASFAVTESLSTRRPSEANVLIGVVVAVVLILPVATRVAAVRWIPATLGVVAGSGSIAVLAMDGSQSGNLNVAIIAGLGFVAAGSSWASGTFLRRQMRTPHRLGAAALCAASVITLVANLDWDFLADIPLPIALVVIGSVTLIGVAATIRVAVQRITTRDEAPTDRSQRQM